MEFTTSNQHLRSTLKLQNVKPFFKQLLMQISSCDLCAQPSNHYSLLCKHCFDDLAIFATRHTQGDLLNWPTINQALPKAQFDHLVCLAPYLWPFTQWLSQLKYHGRFELAHLFAQMLADYWLSIDNQYEFIAPDMVLSVPTHITRWQERGFNQAHLIAKKFALYTDLPYESSLFYRTEASQHQVGQSGTQRRKNLQNAFLLSNNEIKLPKHVMLIDDVVTTGSTASAICQLLKRHNVEKVTLLAVCLSLPEK